LGFRQLRESFNWFDLHSGLDQFHAGLDGKTVGNDQALGALTIGAENSLRCTVFGMVSEDMDAVGEEGGSDRFPLFGLEGLAAPVKFQFFAFWYG